MPVSSGSTLGSRRLVAATIWSSVACSSGCSEQKMCPRGQHYEHGRTRSRASNAEPSKSTEGRGLMSALSLPASRAVGVRWRHRRSIVTGHARPVAARRVKRFVACGTHDCTLPIGKVRRRCGCPMAALRRRKSAARSAPQRIAAQMTDREISQPDDRIAWRYRRGCRRRLAGTMRTKACQCARTKEPKRVRPGLAVAQGMT